MHPDARCAAEVSGTDSPVAPPARPAISLNERLMAARHEEGWCEQKIPFHRFSCLQGTLERYDVWVVLRYWWGISPFDHLLAKKRLTNSLPQLSLITLSPPETAG